MRPVNKGPGVAYVPPANLSWNRFNNQGGETAAWTALTNVFGITTNPNPLVLALSDCLQMLLDLKVGAVVNPAYGTTARTAIMDKATEVYKTAAVPLYDAIGPFCSYCETAIPGLLEVEHRAPKAEYPTLMTHWINFLLTCGPCNTQKGNKPLRANAALLPPPPPLNPNSQSDALFYQRIRDNFTWPDYWNGSFQHFWLDFQISNDAGVSWASMNLSDATNLQNTYLAGSDLATRRVWANVRYNGANYSNVLAQVIVQPVGDDLVGLCGLNVPGNGTYDRRLFNRTLAWFSTLDLMRPLMQINDEQQFNQLWPIIQYSSVSTGFWSLWVMLLSQFNDFAVPRPHSLAYWLYADDDASSFYPGTNTSNITLPPRV